MSFARTQVPSLVPAALAATLAAVAALVPAVPARAGAWVPQPGEHQTELRSSLFSADSWHDLESDRHPLVGGGLWEQRDVVLHHDVGWRKGASVFFTMPFQSVTRRTGDATTWNRTETGLADLVLGARIKLRQGRSALSLDVGWKAPLGYNRELFRRDGLGRALDVTGLPSDSTRAAVGQFPARQGEGQQDLFSTLNWGSPIGRMGFVDLAAGYRYRFEHPADQVLTRADLAFWLGPRILVGGRYSGAQATGEAETPGDAISRYLAGPVLLLRVDDRMDVFAGSLHTVWAENALHTDQFFVGLAVKTSKFDRVQGWLGGTRNP